MDQKQIKILIVVRWPLGGIRTYMRYMFGHFPSNCKLTVLASSTQEDAALVKDTIKYGGELQLVQASGTLKFALEVFNKLRKSRHDLILSQGFISAVVVYISNLIFRIPHILTIHGIVETRYISGSFSTLKKLLLEKILSRVTVLYAVSNDILNHLYEQFPRLKKKGPRVLVIPNGIEPGEFEQLLEPPLNLRETLGIDSSTFLFGFFGRFMPQKGFDLLIEAVDILRRDVPDRNIAVVAVGSGDYVREYQAAIRDKDLGQYFYFIPFQPLVHQLYPQVDVIVIPSRWEACPLLPMEALCMGTPVIASDCIGLRETLVHTPAMVFSSENVNGLVKMMFACVQNNSFEVFQQFVPVARARYDVAKSAQKLLGFIEGMQELK